MRIGYSGRHYRFWRRDIKLIQPASRAEHDKLSKRELGDIALHNLDVLYQILLFNRDNDLPVYALSHNLVPWSHVTPMDLYPQYDQIVGVCASIGEFIWESNQRITVHPNIFPSPATNKESSEDAVRSQLQAQAHLLDLLGLSHSHYTPISISLNTNRKNTEEKFRNFSQWANRLPDNIRKRLVVCNDQKFTRMRVYELLELQNHIEIPILFNNLYHELNSDGQSVEEALEACIETWGDTRPLFYYSESKPSVEWINKSRKMKQDQSTKSYLVYNEPPLSDREIDCIINAEGCEKAPIHLRNKYWRWNG
jgi:UV DNA damage repair endonuclease